MQAAITGTTRGAGTLRKNTFETETYNPAYRGQQASVNATAGARNPARTGSALFFRDHRELWGQNRSLAPKSDLTVAEFVRDKFVPEHVSIKKAAGQNHYRAILKHVLGPLEVDKLFQAIGDAKSRLKPDPGWPYLGEMRLSEVRPAHVKELVTAAQERGYSSQTVLHIRNAVSIIFSHAKRCQYYVGANPALLVKMPKTARKFSHSMTLTEIRNVLGLMRHPEKEMALILMLTGTNIAELCGLQWKHVNLTGLSIELKADSIPPLSIAIRRQWHRGKITDANRKRIRNLEIPELLLGVLLKLKVLSRYVAPDDFVFASRNGAPINPTNIRVRRLKPIGEKLQMPAMSWYMFRRTYVALTSQRGSQEQNSIAMILHSDLSRGDFIDRSPGTLQ